MTVEELIQEKPLTLEFVESAEEAEARAREGAAVETHETEEQRTKKEQILALYERGVTDVARIVRQVAARPSYVAQVLQQAGYLTGYFDLYTTTAREQNIYSRFFRNVLSFKTVEAAKESVERIDRLYNYFERLGDRAGQHQACVIALTGKNRARWSGKTEEAQIFSEWLAAH
jgi:5'-deoxynucleotidase YfbR-like HD superfamily hydrolase